MFIISGGSYKGRIYSWMFDPREQYEYLSPNQKYYYQAGVAEDGIKMIQPDNLLIMLDVNTNQIAHIMPFSTDKASWEENLNATIKRAEEEFRFLRANDDNKKELLAEAVLAGSTSDMEDFLGECITGELMETLREKVDRIIQDMPEEEFQVFLRHYMVAR